MPAEPATGVIDAKRWKWLRWRWWKRYFPVPNRRIEVLIFAVVAASFGLWIKLADSQKLQQQIDLQNKMEALLEIKSEAGVTAALLPYLSCSSSGDNIKTAISIMKASAINQLRAISANYPKDCEALVQAGISTEALRSQIALIANEVNFSNKVNIGIRYYESGLWQPACVVWSEARNVIPLAYLDSKIVKRDDVNGALQECKNENYSLGAHLFREAYRKVLQ